LPWQRCHAIFETRRYIARARGYTQCRLVLQAASSASYNNVRADPIGHDDYYCLGPSGTALIRGTYVSLSDHVTLQKSKKKAGSCMLALLFIDDAKLHGKSYKYFALSSPMPGVNNCICVHETGLLLRIGLAEAI
jgi:hypothetical protein